MPRVGISGYVVGYRLRTSTKTDQRYGVIDLLQFGTNTHDTELVNLLVYDQTLMADLNARYSYGQIRPASFVCDLVFKDKGWMWIAAAVVEYRADVAKQETPVENAEPSPPS